MNNKNIREIPFEKRCDMIQKLKEKYEDNVPIYISHDKNKYDPLRLLLPADLNISHLYNLIRKRIHISETQSIFLFITLYKENKIIKQILCVPTDSIGILYSKYSDPDGMLYINYCFENTFG